MDLNAKKEAIKATIEKRPELEAAFSILLSVNEIRDEYGKSIVVTELQPDDVKSSLDAGIALVQREEVRSQMAVLTDCVKKIATVKDIAVVFEGIELDFEKLIGSWIDGVFDLDTAKKEFGDKGGYVYFAVREALKVFYTAHAEKYHPLVSEDLWRRKECWCCGGLADIATLECDGGKKMLYCSLCDISWAYYRLACSRCGNEDQGTLSYFTPEGDKFRRVDVCDKCKGYLKILDIREKEAKPFMDLEDLLTLDLDSTALAEGYLPVNKLKR